MLSLFIGDIMRALITGASYGLGLDLATVFLNHGYKLLLIDELWCLDKENRDFYRWLNYKVKFNYSDYRNNYLNLKFYLYTAFYKDPGCSGFLALDKHPHLFTEDFSIFVNKLIEIEKYLEENKKRIY